MLLASSYLERTVDKVVSQYVINLSELLGILIAGCKMKGNFPKKMATLILFSLSFMYVFCHVTYCHLPPPSSTPDEVTGSMKSNSTDDSPQ